MTEPELDKVTLVIHESGNEFPFWTSVTISDDFLTPCQSVDLSVGADETRFALTTGIKPGDAFTVNVNDKPQCTGYIDSVEVEYQQHSGTTVRVTGRDGLSRVVDGNADPRMAVAEKMTLEDIAKKLFTEQFALQYTIFDDYAAGRNLALGKPVKSAKAARRRSIKDPLKDARPHDNEGGFAYFCRLAHRSGFHAWAMPDGSGVVLGAPQYDTGPAYEFRTHRGANIGGNIVRAKSKLDATGVPSHVWVRGKDTKPGPKAKFVGFYDNSPNANMFKPFYLKDDESSSKEHCDTVAA